MVAAADEDPDARTALATTLTRLHADPGSAALAAIVQRVVGGERDPALLNGLDDHDTTIVAEMLQQLTPTDDRQHAD